MLKITTEFNDENVTSTLTDNGNVIEKVKCGWDEGQTLDILANLANEKLLNAINIELYINSKLGNCIKCGEYITDHEYFLEVGDEKICKECLDKMSGSDIAGFCGYDMTKV